MKKFVIGDIHGAYKALKQCLERSKFNYEKDELIVLGDVVDGWNETPQAIEELLKIKHLIYVIGNHDVWCRDWFEYGATPIIWTQQGGQATIDSYIKNPELMVKHRDFFEKATYAFLDGHNRLFVHGGVDLSIPFEKQNERYVTWDRDLWDNRHNLEENDYKEIYVGHTSIWNLSHNPANYANVWFMDTGGGWEGKVSIMDVDTKEVWQSDKCYELYKGFKGRR